MATTAQQLTAALDNHQATQTRIAELALRRVVELVAEHTPGADGVNVETSDQDYDGSLTPTGLHTNGNDTDLPDELADELWVLLSHLDDHNAHIWEPFLIGQRSRKHSTTGHLDVAKIITDLHPTTPPVVVVIRDPDTANDITVYGTDADVYDIDLGYANLSDPSERTEWVTDTTETAQQLPERHPARIRIETVIEAIEDKYRTAHGR